MILVDGILLGLLKRGFKRFARVGSLRKIAKPILSHVVHYSSSGKSFKGLKVNICMRITLITLITNP